MARICPQCNSEIGADRNVCPVCFFAEGLKTDTVICTKCQNELDDDARFCPQCGAMASSAEAGAGDPIRAALAAKLESQYRIVRLLGRGGMGCVYLARDLTLEREVAIKVIRTSNDSREAYDRFRREAKTAAKLSHPNIVPLHAFGEVEGMPYFVMGYVRGESLADRLRRDGRLPEDEVRRIVAEIAGALDHAHRQGVIHRDVKPDNVLLDDESGRALLMDFGVAKAEGTTEGTSETLTRHGTVVGTPHYMSPEQGSGHSDIDARSDIYSLGVMAYAMLAGRLPFEGKTVADLLTQHLTREPAPLRSVAPAVSDSTAQAIERCLAKDPAARWPDARSLRLALGVAEESHLPDSLRAVEGRGIPGLAITWLLMLIYALLLSRKQFPARAPSNLLEAFAGFLTQWMIIIIAGLFVFFYLFLVTRLQRDGFSLRQSQSVIWREPAWWLWWYPRALRLRGNAWERLPATVRYLRLSIQVFVAYVFILYTFMCFMGEPFIHFAFNYDENPGPFAMSIGGFAAIVVAWALLTVRARRDLKRKGLAEADVNRVMMSIPPSRVTFWARPHIAAILAPEMRPDAVRPDSPHDHMQSILRHADELSGPFRPLGAQAAVAARQLVASIDHVDREIADLVRNIEAGEEDRLVEKIKSLPAASPGDETAPMRTLLEKQLELIRALSARVEEAKGMRHRRVEMLRALALHVASLRARLTETPSELRQISDNVRSLCDDIGRQVMVLDQGAVPTAAGRDELATVKRT